MPHPGQELVHVITGDRIRYLEVEGEHCRIELRRGPGNFSMGEHYHTLQTESFEVIEGKARFVAHGKEGTLAAGESISFPPGTPHINPWNDGEDELCIIQTLSPALDFATFHENMMEGALRGYVKADGTAKLLPQCVAMHQTKSKVYTTRLPEALQRFVFAVLAPVGLALGYRYGK